MKQLYLFVFGIAGEKEPRIRFLLSASTPVEAVTKAFQREDVLALPAEGTRMGMECLNARGIEP